MISETQIAIALISVCLLVIALLLSLYSWAEEELKELRLKRKEIRKRIDRSRDMLAVLQAERDEMIKRRDSYIKRKGL